LVGNGYIPTPNPGRCAGGASSGTNTLACILHTMWKENCRGYEMGTYQYQILAQDQGSAHLIVLSINIQLKDNFEDICNVYLPELESEGGPGEIGGGNKRFWGLGVLPNKRFNQPGYKIRACTIKQG